MDAPNPPAASAPRWQPIKALDRRVLGVLAEKAKTTPEAYPLSLNALVTGCNQKSNRAPLMEIEADVVEASIDRLKQLGAVVEVQGSSRVARYRHLLYEWLGVDKVELSVMAELLLRGAQTEGELRQRASRMDPIADLAALRGLLQSLTAKKLVVSLTPEGRGHVVSHTLFEEREMDKVRAEFGRTGIAGGEMEEAPRPSMPRPASTGPAANTTMAAAADSSLSSSSSAVARELAALQSEVVELRDQVRQLRYELDELKAALR
ncbi:MAG TPA: DUF480 domain-containing protein [Pirellulales bacterium]|nr:DUF480 domain-containing protein [Pirellulales bacterium]